MTSRPVLCTATKRPRDDRLVMRMMPPACETLRMVGTVWRTSVRQKKACAELDDQKTPARGAGWHDLTLKVQKWRASCTGCESALRIAGTINFSRAACCISGTERYGTAARRSMALLTQGGFQKRERLNSTYGGRCGAIIYACLPGTPLMKLPTRGGKARR